MKKQIAMFSFLAILGSTHTLMAQNETNCKTSEEFRQADCSKEIPAQFTYDEKSKLYYMLANDKDNLYVKFVITDVSTQKKIIAFGNNLWINADGSKKQVLGIQFPVQDKKTPPPPPNKKDDFGVKKFEIVRNVTKAKLIGFSGKNSEAMVEISTAEPYGLKITFTSKGNLVLEYKVPLQSISPTPIPENENKMSIGFITGFLNTSQMQPPGNGSQQGPPPGGEQSREMEEMSAPTKLWITKIKLNKD